MGRVALFGLVVLAGCGGEGDLFVELRTDWVPGQEVVRVDTALDGTPIGSLATAHGDPLARGVRIAEAVAVPLGSHEVAVALIGPGDAVVARRRVRITLRGSLSVTVLVTRDCEGVSCPTTDPSLSECVGGRCVAPECTPETPEACPPPSCEPSACASPVSCAEGVCDSGACLIAPIAGACEPDEYCDPLGGCTAIGRPTLRGVTAIAAGFEHSCALSAGRVLCWGHNLGGALGRPEFEAFAAGEVPGIDDAVEVAAGRHFSCARHEDGGVSCWGDGGFGALGRDASMEPRGTVGRVPGVSGGPMVVGTADVCVFPGPTCWGRNDFQQASPFDPQDPLPPTEVALPLSLGLVLGETHSCLVQTADGTVACWGENVEGQLGDGTFADRATPGPIDLAEPVRAIAATRCLNGAATGATCAAPLEGPPVCWGDNSSGQLGTSAAIAASPVPIPVEGLARADRLWAGAKSFCARDGAATWCWGQNLSGELGIGSAGPFERAAVRAPMLDRFEELALGHGYGCGLDAGRVWCWGSNERGQIDGTPGEPALTAVEVPLR